MSRLPDGDYSLQEFQSWAAGRRPHRTPRGTVAPLAASKFNHGEHGPEGHNGSVRAITDASGAVVAHYEFDAWGAQLGSSSPFSGGFSYGYVGSLGVRTDATTGLLYMRHRWFDPNGLQRFLSRDVLGSLNRYEYCYNNPVSWVDLDGLQPSLPPGWTMTTQSDGVNSYSNPGSLTQLPGHLPPGWSMETQPDGVHAYDNYPRVKLDVKVPDIETPKLPKFKLGDCPDLEEPLSVPGIPLEWPPRDRFPRPNYDPIDPYNYPNEFNQRWKKRLIYSAYEHRHRYYAGLGMILISARFGAFPGVAAGAMLIQDTMGRDVLEALTNHDPVPEIPRPQRRSR